MYFATAALALLAGTALAAPTPQEGGEAAPGQPPFQILTCQAQSIKVKTEWNTAFLVCPFSSYHWARGTRSTGHECSYAEPWAHRRVVRQI